METSNNPTLDPVMEEKLEVWSKGQDIAWVEQDLQGTNLGITAPKGGVVIEGPVGHRWRVPHS